jgi:holliday junction DNA helicase RuvA
MIAYIDGKLVFKDPTYVVIDVNGVGYHIRIPISTYASLKEGERCKLLTYLHIKEDGHTLFGFSEAVEKKTFLDLISISGIGPGTALMVLSSLSASEIRQAIISEDVRTIQNVKGIGAKTAQRIILELKDKMQKMSSPADLKNTPVSSHNTLRNEALSALVTLGIPRVAAEKSVDNILKREGNGISLENLIKMALKSA